MYAVAGAVQVNIYAGAGTVITQTIVYAMSGTVGLLHRLTIMQWLEQSLLHRLTCNGWNNWFITQSIIYVMSGIVGLLHRLTFMQWLEQLVITQINIYVMMEELVYYID